MRGAVALAVAAIIVPARVTLAQGIDCFKAPNAVQRTICTDSSLIALDTEMVSVYRDAIKHATPGQQQALAVQQQRWASGTRDACSKQKDVKGCVTDAYTARNAQLRSMASGEAKLPAGAGASTGSRATARPAAPVVTPSAPAMPPLAGSAPSVSSSSSASSSTAAKKKAAAAPKTGTHVYTCSDQSTLTVTYTKRGRARVRYEGSDVTLPRVKTASGVRYKSGSTSVWNKGTDVAFQNGSKKLTCSE